jgi:hypothetical protein
VPRYTRRRWGEPTPASERTSPRGRISDADLPWRGFALIAGCFLVLALSANLLVPPFDAPDEHSHFHYARLLAQGRGLPVQTDPMRTADTEGFGPPLYYVVPAMILAASDPDRGAAVRHIGVVSFQEIFDMAQRPGLPPMNPRWIGFGLGDDPNLFVHPPGGPLGPGPVRAIHWMRLFSTLCGLATLTALFLMARVAAPGRASVQLLALALVAFNPQFVFLSGVLNNDNLVTVFAAVVLWRTFRLLRGEHAPGRTDVCVLGLAIGLGMLSKSNMMFLAIPLTAVVWLRSPHVRAFGTTMVLIGVLAVATAGWFYARNAWLYGGMDLFGWKTIRAIYPFFVLPAEVRVQALTEYLLPSLFTSFWGRFGWLTLLLPRWQYAFYGLVSAMSVLSLFAAREMRGTLLLLWAVVVANFISLVAYNFMFWANQGRLLFPSIGASAMLIALGTDRAASCLSSSAPRVAAPALAAGLLASVLFAQWGVIFPVYFR